MAEEFKGFIGSRHTERLTDVHSGEQVREEAADYKGISEHGVELSQERAGEIKDMVDNAPASTVLFFGGSSEQQRTKSTTDVYGDTLEQMYKDSTDVLVFSQKTIDKLRNDRGSERNVVNELETYISQNPAKKVIVAYPLFMKEFSLQPDFRTTEAPHDLTAYSMALQPNGRAEHEAVEALLESKGKAVAPDGTIVEGPSAQEIALRYLRGIQRLYEFAQKYAPGRSILVGFVSHGLILDTLTSYLANNGNADTIEGFKATGGKMIESSELCKVEIEGDTATFEYQGKRFDVPKKLLHTA